MQPARQARIAANRTTRREQQKEHPLKTKIFNHIDDVPRQTWTALLGTNSVTMSWEFWKVVEQSRLNDFEYRHVLFFDDQGHPVGLSSFYSITTDIAIFAPAALRAVLNGVRRLFPNFLKWKMLECGTPITINSPPFVKSDALSHGEIIDALNEVLRRTARAEGHSMIIVRDFEPSALHVRENFRRLGYHWVDSLPNTYMDISWASPEQYLASMRSYFRSKLQKHLKRNAEAGVHHRLVDDFHDMAETLCAQWMVVHEHASEFQREVLTPDFYRRLSTDLGGQAKVLLFYRGDALLGHALLLRDRDMLRWLYVGREVAANDSLYIYVAHKVVETAILLGAKRLELGLTTYPIKQDLGAQVTPIKIALRASWWLINPFVGLGYALLNRVPAPDPRKVFKSS